MKADPESPQQAELDLLVLGSGVAGLSAAVRAARGHQLRTGILTKGALDLATTSWAQGGVAAALSGERAELDLHVADTLAAGAGLCDPDAVRVLVDEGPGRVEDLIALGAEFDRDAAGNLELAREGGHSVPRVVHAGGAATGAEIERALVHAVRGTATAVHEHTFASDLIVEDGRCVGVRVVTAEGRERSVRARHVLMATGGAGQLFAVTTNPAVATGDGVAMALRAGVAVADMEFFQFHPTALHHSEMPRPLLSEALRGHGAVLLDVTGERFVDELLPRDVVSRAILASMREHGSDHVWLDARGLQDFAIRFPTIDASLRRLGFDPSTDLVPVAPAAHHQCGGVLTDLDGATTLPGLWAAGETACSGVHGANRLASNSLLEGMVFAPRAVEAIASGRESARQSGAMRSLPTARRTADGIGSSSGDASPEHASTQHNSTGHDSTEEGHIPGVPLEVGLLHRPPVEACAGAGPASLSQLRARLQAAMSLEAGVERSEASLQRCTQALAEVAAAADVAIEHAGHGPGSAELVNLIDNARALVAAARARTESRGTHTRAEFPGTDPAQRQRLVVQHFEP